MPTITTYQLYTIIIFVFLGLGVAFNGIGYFAVAGFAYYNRPENTKE